MATKNNSNSPPKYVLEEAGNMYLDLILYQGQDSKIVQRFSRRWFLEYPQTVASLQKMMAQYTNGKNVFIAKEILYLFDKK